MDLINLMRIGKIVKWSLIALPLAAVIAAAVMYVLANQSPRGYRPARLDAQQRQDAAQQFINRKIFEEFNNRGVQLGQPFDWTITQEQANEALAAMDEIAFDLGQKPQDRGSVARTMDRLGLAEPAVCFDDDTLRLMIRSRRYDKILSADLGFEFTGEGKLRVRVKAVRVGMLAVPQSMVQDQFRALTGGLTASGSDASGAGSSPFGPSSQDLGKVLKEVFLAVEGREIAPAFKYPGNRPLRIDAIRMSEGKLTLHVRPLPPSQRR